MLLELLHEEPSFACLFTYNEQVGSARYQARTLQLSTWCMPRFRMTRLPLEPLLPLVQQTITSKSWVVSRPRSPSSRCLCPL